MALNPTIGGGGLFVPPPSRVETWPEFINDYPLPINATVINFPGMVADSRIKENTSSQSKAGTGRAIWATPYNGRGGVFFDAGAAGSVTQGCEFFDLTPASMDPNFEADQSYSDQYAYKRCIVHMMFEGTGGFASGCGVQWAANNVGNGDVKTGAKGFGFMRTAAGVVSVISRATFASAVVTTPVFSPAAGDAEIRKFHAYEAMAYPAMLGTPAKIVFRINGADVLSRNIGVGADVGFPTDALATTGLYGFGMKFFAMNNLNTIIVARARYIVGPTERSVMMR